MTSELIFTVLGGIFTLMILFGIIKMKKEIILSGLFYYSFLPVIGEPMGYIMDKQPFHLLFIALFLCQMILTTIKFENIEDVTPLFSKFAFRVIGCLMIINGVSAVLILKLIHGIPMIFGIYHVIITIVLVLPFLKRLSHSRES